MKISAAGRARPPSRGLPTSRTLPTVVRYSGDRRSVIARRVRRGDLVRLRRGRYVAVPDDGGGPAARLERRVLALIAAVAATLRTSYWFSHETAALLHGLPVYRLGESVHVTQQWKPPARGAGDGSLVRHAIALPERDRTTVSGLPATTLERTLVDCARWLPGVRALVIADAAMRAGARREVCTAILAEASGRKGVRQARTVVALADPNIDSPGESIVRWHVHEADLPQPEVSVPVDTWRGTFWVDLGWPDLKLGIEFDGAVKYSGGEYGEPGERLLAEKRRHDALIEAGWTIIRVVWDDLSDPGVLVERIRRALASARRPR